MIVYGIVEGFPFHLDPSQMDLEIMEIHCRSCVVVGFPSLENS